jgi:hypothetical protein
MKKERFIVYPLLVVMASILIGVGIVAVEPYFKAYKEVNWAVHNRELVNIAMEKQASSEAELRLSLKKSEKTAQEKLIEAVTDQVKTSK